MITSSYLPPRVTIGLTGANPLATTTVESTARIARVNNIVDDYRFLLIMPTERSKPLPAIQQERLKAGTYDRHSQVIGFGCVQKKRKQSACCGMLATGLQHRTHSTKTPRKATRHHATSFFAPSTWIWRTPRLLEDCLLVECGISNVRNSDKIINSRAWELLREEQRAV